MSAESSVMTITRRSFFIGLMATSSLVAAPGAAFATVSKHDRMMALLEASMAEAQRRMIEHLNKSLFDDSAGPQGFGLRALLDDYE